MPALTLPPPLTPLPGLTSQLATNGYAVIGAATLAQLAGVAPQALADWQALWDDLPPDAFLKDGGRYRRRRHGCFIVNPGGAKVGAELGAGPGAAPQAVQAVPHRAHWQPVEYNALHGGIERWFEPLPPQLAASTAWQRLLLALAAQADALCAAVPQTAPWFVEAHPFRIDTTDGIGRPTPEGAHRDGVDLVVVVLVARVGIKGGETRVFEAQGPAGLRFTLTEPWSALLLDDARVIHESTPIQPLDPAHGGHRDTLVLTFRRGGFQGPDQGPNTA